MSDNNDQLTIELSYMYICISDLQTTVLVMSLTANTTYSTFNRHIFYTYHLLYLMLLIYLLNQLYHLHFEFLLC